MCVCSLLSSSSSVCVCVCCFLLYCSPLNIRALLYHRRNINHPTTNKVYGWAILALFRVTFSFFIRPFHVIFPVCCYGKPWSSIFSYLFFLRHFCYFCVSISIPILFVSYLFLTLSHWLSPPLFFSFSFYPWLTHSVASSIFSNAYGFFFAYVSPINETHNFESFPFILFSVSF